MDILIQAHIGSSIVAGFVRAAGWEPLPPEWPSCYFNKALCMAGKKVNFPGAWKRLVDGGLVLDEPAPASHFPGCRH